MTAPRQGWLRWAEAGLVVAATAGMALAARPPEAGDGWRSVFVVAALIAGGGVVWTGLRRDWTARSVLGVALLLRLLVFPLPPALSDDGYRYVWDGQLQAQHGIDPYRYRPDDPALEVLHEEPIFDRLNSPGYYTVYPPLSQLVFALGGLVYPLGERASWYLIKGLFVLVELLGLYLLSRWVRGGALLLYAWHPLAVVEGAGQGHLETLAVGLLLGMLWAARHRRSTTAGALLAMAGWVKLLPFVLMPFVARRLGWRVWLGGGVAGALLAVPYASAYWWPHVTTSLDLYVRLFEFNAGPYYALKGLGWWVAGEDWSKSIGPLLQWAFLGCVALLLVPTPWRTLSGHAPLPVVVAGVFGLFFALATTVHPWYLMLVLAFVPLLVDRPRTRLFAFAWLWLSVCSMATYWHYAGPSWGYTWAVAVGWSGWALFLIAWAAGLSLPRLMQRRGKQKWRWISEALPELAPEASVLDLGAGEGHVGWAAHESTGVAVHLADVVDFRTVTLSFTRYDGRTLPFEEDAFDVILLVYVLHHAEDPERVLQEAARVARGPVVVVESLVVSAPQARVLRVLDTLANRIHSGGRMRAQEAALHFRTDAAWRETFNRFGLRLAEARYRGRWIHPRALYVVEAA